MTAGENIVAAMLSARGFRPIDDRDRRLLRRVARRFDREIAAAEEARRGAVLAEVRVPVFMRDGGER